MKHSLSKTLLVISLLFSAIFGHESLFAQARRGTSDTGGGTGLDGKVFESYIKDPMSLPAGKLVEKYFENIVNEDPDEHSYTLIAKSKVWYIAPVDLRKINKESLGVGFLETATDQIAIQTKNEIWVNKAAFDKMSLEEQSDIILHEIVMSMYFTKFLTLAELCHLSAAVDPKSSDCDASDLEKFDKAIPPEKWRAFNRQDNENIRFVVGWLKNNYGKKISDEQFRKVLLLRGFDKRLFGSNKIDEKQLRIDTTHKGLFQSIKAAELSGHDLNQCEMINKKTILPCDFDIETIQIPYAGQHLPGFKMRLAVSGESPIELDFSSSEERSLMSVKGFNGDLKHVDILLQHKEVFKVGDRIYNAVISLQSVDSSHNSPLVVKSILLKPSVIVSIDKKREVICQTMNLRPKKAMDDAIYIFSEGSSGSEFTDLVWVENQGFVNCNTSNVIE